MDLKCWKIVVLFMIIDRRDSDCYKILTTAVIRICDFFYKRFQPKTISKFSGGMFKNIGQRFNKIKNENTIHIF